MTLREFIQVFSNGGKLGTEMCVVRYSGSDYISAELDLHTELPGISLAGISMDSRVCHAYYEDGCLFVELDPENV